VLAGGAESLMTPPAPRSFSIMRALSPSGRSRPFDAARDGFCLSEGAAVLVLEEREAALARGAQITARCSARRRAATPTTSPRPRRRQRRAACMRLALEDAELTTSDVRAVNAHGTSTPLNDAAEGAAVTPSSARPACPSRASRA
jgi:3-oxoacyl-[acyl-carrier-protein] synthase II